MRQTDSAQHFGERIPIIITTPYSLISDFFSLIPIWCIFMASIASIATNHLHYSPIRSIIRAIRDPLPVMRYPSRVTRSTQPLFLFAQAFSKSLIPLPFFAQAFAKGLISSFAQAFSKSLIGTKSKTTLKLHHFYTVFDMKRVWNALNKLGTV